MKLVNSAAIDEDAQNEIQSMHSNITSNHVIRKGLTSDSIKNDENLNENYLHHVIWAGHLNDDITSIQNELSRLKGLTPSLVTMLTREPTHIINCDHCIELQHNGGHINGKKVNISIGDDIENLLQRISSQNFMTNRDIFDLSDGFQTEEVDSYHFYEMSDNKISHKSMLHSLNRYPRFWKSDLGNGNWEIKKNIDEDEKMDCNNNLTSKGILYFNNIF